MKNPEELQKAIEDSPNSEFIMFKIRPSVGDEPDPEEVASTVKPEKQGKGKVTFCSKGGNFTCGLIFLRYIITSFSFGPSSTTILPTTVCCHVRILGFHLSMVTSSR